MVSARFNHVRPRHLIAAVISCATVQHASATPTDPNKWHGGGTVLPAEYIESPNGATQLLLGQDKKFHSRRELSGNSCRWLIFYREVVMLLSMIALLAFGSPHAQAQVIYVSTSATTNGGIVSGGGTLEAGINYTVRSKNVPGGDTVTKVELMEGSSILNSKLYTPRFKGTEWDVLNDQHIGTLSANLGVGPHEVFLRSTTYYGQRGDSPSYTVNVTLDGLLPQSITFPAISSRTLDSGPFTVSATASSGLPVSFISANTAVCTIAGSTVNLVSTGTCTIAADQSGDNSYAAASEVTQSFPITQKAQTAHTQPDSLLSGEILLPGEYIESPNGAAQLLMRYDGNLVLYRLEDDSPVWETHSADHPQAYAVLQSDGNLVVYSPDGQTQLFSTGTFAPGATLVLQADENLALLPREQPGIASSMQAASGTGGILWSSNTSVPNPPEADDMDTDRLPLDPGPEVPSTDQNACTEDREFWQVDGPGDSSNGLVNRHVLCVKQRLTRYTHIPDAEGRIRYNSGIMTLDAKWSIHGVHNKLEKKGTLSLRYVYTPDSELPAPIVKVVAKISCHWEDIETDVNCDRETPVLALASGTQSTAEVVLPITWTGSAKIAKARILITLFYTTDGTPPDENIDWSWTKGKLEPAFHNWILRCDIDQLRKTWKGCVFPFAAAVWDPDKSSETQYARQHIADVFGSMPNVPGRFKMAPASQSQAETGGQYDPLTRNGPAGNRANRVRVKERCKDLPRDPQYCAPGMSCDCDEYPFASSEEGADGKEYDQFSVRKIPHWDNRKAGAQLGGMYATERVLLGDKFWVKVD
jgi:hypothetical protein